MNVSPSHAKPRIPITAVSPAWQVFVFTIWSTGARVNNSIAAATVNITMAIVIGIETVTGASTEPTLRNTGKSPQQTTTPTPARNNHAERPARGGSAACTDSSIVPL